MWLPENFQGKFEHIGESDYTWLLMYDFSQIGHKLFVAGFQRGILKKVLNVNYYPI
jgi:hypothetical protein